MNILLSALEFERLMRECDPYGVPFIPAGATMGQLNIFGHSIYCAGDGYVIWDRCQFCGKYGVDGIYFCCDSCGGSVFSLSEQIPQDYDGRIVDFILQAFW